MLQHQASREMMLQVFGMTPISAWEARCGEAMDDEQRPEPSVDRPPVWIRWAAPGKYTFSASVIGAAAGAALVNALGASDWFYALGGPLLATIVDVIWRRHVPTSAESRGPLGGGRPGGDRD
jgi:hypothetical protein